MIIEDAVYREHNLEEFIGNPLIAALPHMISPNEYPKSLIVLPPYKQSDRLKSPSDRLLALKRLEQLHIPTVQDSMILMSITRCLLWGYASRNPLDFNVVKSILKEHGIPLTEGSERYLKVINAPIYGFPVLGISGVGKTTSLQNVLTLFPQVIQHKEYHGVGFEHMQLVWLKVDCPGDGTPKGLCSAILRGIDDTLGTHYAQQILTNRMSKDVLLIKVSQLVQSLYLGILVIDDIQNLCSAKNDVSDELLSFMVSMANNLRIPVIQVGSPKVLTLLQKEFQVAKRASGEGEIRMDLMKKSSPEWDRFITTLWKYQYTKEEIELTDTLKEVFFDLSVGNPFIAATLYKIVQDEAIISGREHFTDKDVKRIEKSQMGMTVKMRRDMLNGVDVELNRYHALWEAAHVPPSPSANAQKGTSRVKSEVDPINLESEIANQLLGEIALTLQEARVYARRAIAANPGEDNISSLLGYAKILHQKANESTSGASK